MKPCRLALCLLTLLAVPGLAPAGEILSGPELYKKCVRSCVFIVTISKHGQAAGSGSLIDAEQRIVLTNYHVVEDEDKVYVQFPVYTRDGEMMVDKKKYIERIPAGQAIIGKVMFRDKSRDLALVRLEKIPPGTKALPLAKKSVEPGTTVINIGNPGAVDQVFSTTRGEVRQVGMRDFVIPGGPGEQAMRIKCKMVAATNPVNPGDSGGPLIDERGFQIAVTQSGIFGLIQNVNAFVDVMEVRKFLFEKKITIKELADDGPDPKFGDGVPKEKGAKPKGPFEKEEPREDVKPKEKGKDADPKEGSPSAKDEKDADMALQQAKLFKEEDKEYYASKLKTVISKYPGTRAAKEAKKLLDAINK